MDGCSSGDDPSDWPKSFQELRTLDSLLRCSICYEYFNIAVMVAHCSHNYCSLCIRKYLSYEMHCPSCACKMTESDLKCNRVLDELVKTFQSLRFRLLKLVKSSTRDVQEEVGNPTKDEAQAHVKTEKETLECFGSAAAGSSRKRRKLDADTILDSGDEFLSVSLNRSHSTLTLSERPENEECKKDKVSCPVCTKLISSANINRHLDVCLARDQRSTRCKRGSSSSTVVSSRSPQPSPPSENRKKSGSNQFIKSSTTRRRLLPKLLYSTLKEKQLRKTLKEYKLSTKGDRRTLAKRLQQFTVTYNAQCDAVHPLSVEDIAKQVHTLEMQETKLKEPSTLIHTFDRTKTEEEKKQFNVHYLKSQSGHFEKLINDIQLRKDSKKPTPPLKIQMEDTDKGEVSDSSSSTTSEGITFTARHVEATEVRHCENVSPLENNGHFESSVAFHNNNSDSRVVFIDDSEDEFSVEDVSLLSGSERQRKNWKSKEALQFDETQSISRKGNQSRTSTKVGAMKEGEKGKKSRKKSSTIGMFFTKATKARVFAGGGPSNIGSLNISALLSNSSSSFSENTQRTTLNCDSSCETAITQGKVNSVKDVADTEDMGDKSHKTSASTLIPSPPSASTIEFLEDD